MKDILEKIPLQFPLVNRPYEEMAEKIGMSEDELISTLKSLKRSGELRRAAAVLYHRKVFYSHNTMVVWKVDEKDVEKTGTVMASFPEVSHCYERDTGGYWPYNLYTMVHARCYEDCMKSIEHIASKTGINDYRIFFSKREFKKTSFSMNPA
jgi:DNA-binding Lrp family transcriptional regulator